YIDSANIQNISRVYGSLIEKLRSKLKSEKDRMPGDIQLEFLNLREQVAMRAIECYAGEHRNWSDLAEVLSHKGDLYLKQEKHGKAIKNFNNAIKAYERGIEVIKELYQQSAKENKCYFQKQIALTLGKRASANANIGRLEESQKDLKRAIEIRKSPEIEENTEKDEKWLFEYTKRSICRDFFTMILESVLNLTNSAIMGEERERLSYGWYNVAIQLEPRIDIQFDPGQECVGDYIKDFKKSALYRSLKLNHNNQEAKKALNELVDDNFYEFGEKKYSSRFHDDYAVSLISQKQFSEILHRIFSASIKAMNFMHHLFTGDMDKEKSRRKNLSRRWGILGRRISDDFISMIPHKIAIRCFEFSVFFRPDNLDSWYNLGWEYLNDYRVDKALEAFNKNLKLEEEKGQKKYSHLSKIGLGKIHEERKDAKLAANCFKEGVELCIELYGKKDPQKTVDLLIKTAESLKGLTLLNIQEDEKIEIMKDILDVCDRALEISQSNQLTDFQKFLQEKIKRVKWQAELKKRRKIYPMYSLNRILEMSLIELLSIESRPERLDTLYKKENAFTKLGKYDKTFYRKAVECANKILDQNPTNVFTWINKAQNLGNLERYDESLESVEQALVLSDKNILALHNKGLYLLKLGDRKNNEIMIEEAIELFNKSLELDPNYVPAWYNKGSTLQRLKRYKEAKESYENALKLEPDNIMTFTNYSKVCKKLEKTNIDNENLEYLNELLNKCPTNFRFWNQKGYVLSEMGRYDKAIECFDNALKLNRKNISIWHNIIYATLHLGLKLYPMLSLNKILDTPLIELLLIESKPERLISEELLSTTPTNLLKKALSEIDDTRENDKFIAIINKSFISWIKNTIFECDVTSKEELISLLKEVERIFGKLGVRTPTLDEIENKCKESRKYEVYKEKVMKIFG
ncbi:MAG: tetratricopeptide repeat protein, partial [Candidatus Hodarchaeota archaeon]